MKEFQMPELVEVNNLYIEPVYAASGLIPTTPEKEYESSGGNGDFKVETEWCNHNSGSHSEIKIHIHNYGKDSGDNIHMSFFIRDFRLDSIIPGDGCLILSNLSENHFDLARVGRHFNPGEDIQFVMQLKCKKPGGAVGAVGQTGVQMPCSVHCTGVYTS